MKKRLFLALCLAITLSVSAQHNDNCPVNMPDESQVPAYTKEDTWVAYEAFNTYFLDSKKNIYKEFTTDQAAIEREKGAAAIWCQPMYVDMAMNAFKRAQEEKSKKLGKRYARLSKDLIAGNKAHYVDFNFDDQNIPKGWFIYDDIMWWTITLARAYETFSDKSYLEASERSFARVWYGSPKELGGIGDHGSYDPQTGGMYWDWDQKNPGDNTGHYQSACINFPTVVAAMTLYNNVPKGRKETKGSLRPEYQTKEQYLEKAKAVYLWGTNNLFDSQTGVVADGRHGQGRPAWDHCLVYNQATFIGASVLLYKATGEEHYLKNAILAADHTVHVLSAPLGLLPFKKGIEQGIYTTIFAQYIAMLVYDCGQTQYLPFIQRTIKYGWLNRDESRNLTGGDYAKKWDQGAKIESYSASGIPALMLLFPAEKR
ncbi:MAG: glycoside hydrolase family 76 protein [Bacteroidales bacterium]|jgi:predicted alpha-1,6-mannanase (GH76 family)|nr:glycoside hydrolase family 76 protein [Bacteroidales bacterium]